MTDSQIRRVDYLNHVWLSTFADWDCRASTAEAVLRANEATERAERRWDQDHPPRG